MQAPKPRTYLQILSLQRPLTIKIQSGSLFWKSSKPIVKTEVFDRYKFWQRYQSQGENIDQWVNDLRILLSTCEYGQQKESNLRDRIVFGKADIRVKERLLRESDLTVEKSLHICHAAEASKEQMKVIASDNQCHEMNTIIRSKDMSVNRRKPTRCGINAETSNMSNHHSTQGGSCAYCGSKHPPRKCPAYGVICSKCKGRNHFAKVSKGGGFRKKVYQLETDHPDDNGYLLWVQSKKAKPQRQNRNGKQWYSHSVNFKLDTGSEANVLPATVYKADEVGQTGEKIRLCCMRLVNIKWSH